MTADHWTIAHQPFKDWLLAHGYVYEDNGTLSISWSDRIGYDSTGLEFWPWVNRAGVACLEAIVNHHASGTNPRLAVGTCVSLAEVQELHDLLRRLNGYEVPEPERDPVHSASESQP